MGELWYSDKGKEDGAAHAAIRERGRVFVGRAFKQEAGKL